MPEDHHMLGITADFRRPWSGPDQTGQQQSFKVHTLATVVEITSVCLLLMLH